MSSTESSPKLTTLLSNPIASTVTSLGAVIFGAVVSTTVTVCVAVTKLPDESVAIHVTTVSPNGNTSGASFAIITGCTSITVGATSFTTFSSIDVASKIIFSGEMICGIVVSITEIFCVVVAMFPASSDAIHVIVVSPMLKEIGASFVIDKILPLSTTVASPRSTTFSLKLVASTTTSFGAVIVGEIVSTTVTF